MEQFRRQLHTGNANGAVPATTPHWKCQWSRSGNNSTLGIQWNSFGNNSTLGMPAEEFREELNTGNANGTVSGTTPHWKCQWSSSRNNSTLEMPMGQFRKQPHSGNATGAGNSSAQEISMKQAAGGRGGPVGTKNRET
eukprot:gene16258-biopygen3297